MNAIGMNNNYYFEPPGFRGRWFAGISPSNALGLLLVLAWIPKFILALTDGIARLVLVSRTLSTAMAQVKANSNFPQPGWFEESSSPMIDPVKGMEMMLRPTAFCAIHWPAIAILAPISCRGSIAGNA